MENELHSQQDLMSEWIKGTSREYQCKRIGEDDSGFVDCIDGPSWLEGLIYRLKPREFIKGHWYPCIDKDGDSMVYMFNGALFQIFTRKANGGFCPSSFKWIGESLGEIKFDE